MTDLLEDDDLSELVDEFEPIMCESTLHMIEWKLPPHEAHWYASSACCALIAICDDRKRKCFRDGSWKCVSGCSAVHPYDEIDFTPIGRA